VKVTAKRLHRERRPGAHVDMLITELDFVSYVSILQSISFISDNKVHRTVIKEMIKTTVLKN